MTDDRDYNERHSKASEAELIFDPDERAAREASNGLQQIDAVVEIVEHHLQHHRPFKLRLSTLLLHRIALNGITSFAGNFRPAGIEIGGSSTSRRAPILSRRLRKKCAITSTTTGNRHPRFTSPPTRSGD